MAPISYQLIINLTQAANIHVGKLGLIHFPAGQYVYTGSARRNLEQRLQRHQQKQKRLRWHIDYLLSHPAAHIVEIKKSQRQECLLNQRTRGTIPVRGFGASDCRAGCGSHLKYRG